jgi:hypothetical protein
MLTAQQMATVKADIEANPDLVAFPNDGDGAFAIAKLYNLPASPAWTVWQTAVPMDSIQDAVVYANMTPAQAIPSTPQLDVLVWSAKALQCQSKQFNLQNLMLGRQSINASKANIRAAFQDCLTSLPSKSDGTNQPAGWTAVQTAMQRTATRLEKLLSSGTGTAVSPATMTFEGNVDSTAIDAARNS